MLGKKILYSTDWSQQVLKNLTNLTRCLKIYRFWARKPGIALLLCCSPSSRMEGGTEDQWQSWPPQLDLCGKKSLHTWGFLYLSPVNLRKCHRARLVCLSSCTSCPLFCMILAEFQRSATLQCVKVDSSLAVLCREPNPEDQQGFEKAALYCTTSRQVVNNRLIN